MTSDTGPLHDRGSDELHRRLSPASLVTALAVIAAAIV
jgi:hypothetical protein